MLRLPRLAIAAAWLQVTDSALPWFQFGRGKKALNHVQTLLVFRGWTSSLGHFGTQHHGQATASHAKMTLAL